jgi:hypothetical protein
LILALPLHRGQTLLLLFVNRRHGTLRRLPFALLLGEQDFLLPLLGIDAVLTRSLLRRG